MLDLVSAIQDISSQFKYISNTNLPSIMHLLETLEHWAHSIWGAIDNTPPLYRDVVKCSHLFSRNLGHENKQLKERGESLLT